MDLPERFWTRVNKTEGCWLWTGLLNDGGYGRTSLNKRQKMAHRWAYEVLVGPIPDGMELDHLCRVRTCVRPDHLEPVTHAENVRRGIAGEVNRARQVAITECKNGHAFDEGNTYVTPDGKRACRACHRARQALRDHRARVA